MLKTMSAIAWMFSATDYTPVFCAAQRVDYSDDYPTVNLITTPNEKQIDLIFLTKFTGWHYEQRVADYRSQCRAGAAAHILLSF